MAQSSDFKLTILHTQSSTPSSEFEIKKAEIIIGRDENFADVTISIPEISRRHARLIREGNGYVVEDLGSSNGTFVNGQQVAGRCPLKSGDQIQLGRYITLVYTAPVSESAATAFHASPAIAGAGMQTIVGEEPMPASVSVVPPQLIVTIAGERSTTHTLTGDRLTIGRAEGNDIVIASQIV